ncbi:MAG TPA: hypothetical protein VI075_01555 [Methyloceanibacter sp.]
MGRRHTRGGHPSARARKRGGTVLASTLILGSLLTPTPAAAVACIQPASLNDNQATLVSTGTTFILKDNLQDVWGEVSAGVNFFNPSANTSVFAKLDVTFGDDIDGSVTRPACA